MGSRSLERLEKLGRERGRGPVFRVGSRCIICRKGRILVQKAEGEDYYRLPGGRLEGFETLEQCVRREMIEELGVDVDILGLAFINENFFWRRGKLYHEIMFYYNCRIRGEPNFAKIPGLLFEWKRIDELVGNFRPKALLSLIKIIVERGPRSFCNKYILTVDEI